MGLFDGFTQRKFDSFTQQQAIMTIVVAAVKADGHVSAEEFARIKAMCLLSPIFAANSGDQDGANLEFADAVTTQLGEEAITRAAAALTPELRETAFVFACDMVLADGVLGADEDKFINGLARKLSLRENAGPAIVYTSIARNRSLA